MSTAKRNQSFAGYVRERLADIESQLDVGVRQEAILDELVKSGGYEDVSLQTFRTVLWRARQTAASKAPAAPLQGVKPPSPVAPAGPAPKTPRANPGPAPKPGDGRSFNYSGTKDIDPESLI